MQAIANGENPLDIADAVNLCVERLWCSGRRASNIEIHNEQNIEYLRHDDDGPWKWREEQPASQRYCPIVSSLRNRLRGSCKVLYGGVYLGVRG